MRDAPRTGDNKSSKAKAPSRPFGEAALLRKSGSQGEEPVKQTESLRLVHHHPGYLRIRASAFLQSELDSPIVKSARVAAEGVAGFRAWSLNPRTGSVVIKYDPEAVEADDLLNEIAKRGGFRGVEIPTRRKQDRRQLVSALLDTVQDVNRTVAELTGERADLRELVPLALVAVSALSFVVNDERSRLPHWFGALYRSYRVFMHWHRPEVRRRERIARQAEKGASASSDHEGDRR